MTGSAVNNQFSADTVESFGLSCFEGNGTRKPKDRSFPRQNETDLQEETFSPTNSNPPSVLTTGNALNLYDITSMLPLKRSYQFKTRRPKIGKESKSHKWRTEVASRTGHQWRTLFCCKKQKCFQKCNLQFLRFRLYVVLSMSLAERRRFLHGMLTSEGKFSFDGSIVCQKFLHLAFHFSTDLQVSVKSHGLISLGAPGNGSEHEPSSKKSESIVSFLRLIAESTADKMPNTNEYHIPNFQKAEVYEHFISEFKRIETDSPPSSSYFMSIWTSRCSEIKVRKSTRFSLCSICEHARNSIRRAIASGRDTSQYLQEQKQHKEHVKKEREAYASKKDMAKLYPEKYCSIIIDGADQSAYGLPHFATSSKDARGHGLKVRLIGVLEHGAPNRLHLTTMSQEYETGSNHIVESIHRFLSSRNSRGSLPSTLFIQADNCTRENKNRFLLAYLECLVSWGVFDEIELAFLPIGHTHEDIDQCFSCTSRRLRVNDAITLSDLHAQLRTVYNSYTTVSDMRSVANFKGLCDMEKCIRDPPPFAHFRYFNITRNGTGETKTRFLVKEHVMEDWKEIKSKTGTSFPGFLRNAPNLFQTPPMDVVCPEGLKEVSDRIQSEEWRIPCSKKLRDLRDLRDRVFASRCEQFSWNLQRAPEIIGRKSASVEKVGDICDTFQSGELFDDAVDDFFYDRNAFVIVKYEKSNTLCPFWLARIRKVFKNSQAVATKLDVHWYELSGRTTGDPYGGSYQPSFLNVDAKKKASKKPWTDIISVDTVQFHFEKLTKAGIIPADVRKKVVSQFASSQYIHPAQGLSVMR